MSEADIRRLLSRSRLLLCAAGLLAVAAAGLALRIDTADGYFLAAIGAAYVHVMTRIDRVHAEVRAGIADLEREIREIDRLAEAGRRRA